MEYTTVLGESSQIYHVFAAWPLGSFVYAQPSFFGLGRYFRTIIYDPIESFGNVLHAISLACAPRAAARAALMRRFAARRRIDVVSSVQRPGGDGGIHLGAWIEGDDGVLFRFSTIPAGMTIAEAERIVSQPGWKPTVTLAQPGSIRPPLKPEW